MEKEPQLNENDVTVFWMEESRNRDTLKTCWYIHIFFFLICSLYLWCIMKINDYMISEKEKDQCSLMISAGKPGGDSPTQACKHCDHKCLLENTVGSQQLQQSPPALWSQVAPGLPGWFGRMQVSSKTIFLLCMVLDHNFLNTAWYSQENAPYFDNSPSESVSGLYQFSTLIELTF